MIFFFYIFYFIRVRVGSGGKEVPACGDGCGPCQVHSVVHDLAWPVDLSSSGMYSFACCTIITCLGARQTLSRMLLMMGDGARARVGTRETPGRRKW